MRCLARTVAPVEMCALYPSLLGVMLAAAVAACGGDASSTSSASARATSSSSAASAEPGTSGSAATTASALTSGTADAPGAPTTGEVETLGKKKIGYSIVLPEGLKDVSEFAYIKDYRKEPKKFDGYSVSIMEAKPAIVLAGLDGMIAEAEKAKGKVLKKDKWDDGWYVAVAIDERGKKGVVLQGITSRGELSLTCRGNVEGDLAADGPAAADVVARACRTLKITSP